MLDEIELLKRNGQEVAPFSMQFEKNLHSEYSNFFPAAIKYENIKMIEKIFTGPRMIYSYNSKTELLRLINFFNPDLIHAHIIQGRLTTSVIDAAKEKHLPVVMSLHDYKLICPSYLMLNKGEICEKCKGGNFYFCVAERCHKGALLPSLLYTLESYFTSIFKKYSWVKYFICPSKFILQKHVEFGVPAGKLVYIPNSIETTQYEPRFEGGKYILFVGRISKEKGIPTLIKAARGIKASIRIVGDGPMRKKYEDYAIENGINNVIFDGRKSGAELEELFKNALFLVLPSEWYENAPMAVLEAFAYGKPVIGSEIGGIPEMITENENGLLFKPGDFRQLEEKIKYLLSSPSLLAAMGKKARERVEKEYNTSSHYQKLMDVYKKAQREA